MAANLYINHFDYYIPENEVYLKELDSLFEETIPEYYSLEHLLEFSKNAFRMDSVRVEDKISPEEVLRRIVKKTIDSGVINPYNIDYILIAPIFNSSLKDFGHHIQHEFAMRNAKVIRIGDNYSVNIDIAINIASKLVLNAEHKNQNILIIGGDFLGNNFKRRIINKHAIIADNTSLLLVSNKNNGAKFIFKNQEVFVKGQLNENNEKVDDSSLHFKAYCRCLLDIMTYNKLKPAEIKKIITHNANLFLIEQALSVNKIQSDKIFRQNWGKYGHLGVTDLMLNLSDFGKEKGNVGDKIISLNMGITGTYVASLFERITQ